MQNVIGTMILVDTAALFLINGSTTAILSAPSILKMMV